MDGLKLPGSSAVESSSAAATVGANESVSRQNPPLLKSQQTTKAAQESSPIRNFYRTEHPRQYHSTSDLIANMSQNASTSTLNKPSMAAMAASGTSLGTSGSSDSNESISENDKHCHTDAFAKYKAKAGDPKARRTLIMATVLCLLFMVAEIVGGAIAQSLAIMTDAAHLLTDVASFLISIFSLYVASRPATRRMSFGWHRAEVIGAVFSVLLIWVVTGILVYLAIERVINGKYEIDAVVMLSTASVGVGVNIIMALLLHYGGGHGHSHGGGGHSHGGKKKSHGSRASVAATNSAFDIDEAESGKVPNGNYPAPPPISDGLPATLNLADDLQTSDKIAIVSATRNSITIVNQDLETTSATVTNANKASKKKHKPKHNINVRAAFIHVLGDFLQSLGVLVAALIIYFKKEWAIADPICTFIFSVIVLFTTLTVLRDALNVLMEGKPHGIDFQDVTATLLSIKGVKKVHNLRIWSLTLDKVALAVHLAIDDSVTSTQAALKESCELLASEFDVYECTVQIEHYSNDMDECRKCESPTH